MKYCIQFRDEKLPISEEEIPKVLEAMANKNIVVLKCGVVNGAFISAILKDIHAEYGFNYGYKFQGSDNISRKSYLTDLEEKLKIDRLQLEKNPLKLE